MSLKFSPLSNPLPPDTTILAVPNSGLSDFVSSLLRNFVNENQGYILLAILIVIIIK